MPDANPRPTAQVGTRLLWVDDHAIVRAGYRHLLQRQPGLSWVGEAGCANEAYALARQHHPDVVVTDMSLPGQSGLELTRRLLAAEPQTKVLMFTMHTSADLAQRALQAGALGFVTKSSPAEALLEGIAQVARGQRHLSADIARELAQADAGCGGSSPLDELSPREFEVLRLLMVPLSVQAIAQALHLSEKTVCNLHYQIKRKLGVGNDIALTQRALVLLRAWDGSTVL